MLEACWCGHDFSVVSHTGQVFRSHARAGGVSGLTAEEVLLKHQPACLYLCLQDRLQVKIDFQIRQQLLTCKCMQVLVSALGQALGAPAAENCIRPSQGAPRNEVAAVEATVHLSPAMQVGWALTRVSKCL